MHTDAGELNFRWKHWHIDYRFLRGESDAEDLNSVGGQPLMLQSVVPEPCGKDYFDNRANRYQTCQLTRDEWEQEVEADLRTRPLCTWQKRARWKQRRTYDNYRIAGRLAALSEALKGDYTLDLDTMICPHRGTDLRDIKPENGVIQCPLHGLQFCAKTGRRVKR